MTAPGRGEVPGKAIWAPPPLTLRPGAGRRVGAAGVRRRRRRGHPRGSPMSRCPCAGDLGAGYGWAACGARGGAGRGRVLRPGCPLAASGSGRRRPAQTPPEAGAWAGGEGRAAPAGPPGALGLGRGGRAVTQRRDGPGAHAAGPRRGSLPTRSGPRLSVLSPALEQPGGAEPWISLLEPLRESLNPPELQSPHPEIGGNNAPTCQGHWEDRTS